MRLPLSICTLAFLMLSTHSLGSGVPQPASAEVTELDLASKFEGLDACFLLLEVETGKLSRFNAEQCRKRSSPCSTFKIPNTLIGLETGVLSGADHLMKWDGKKRWREELNRDHDLRSAIEHSVVWYYQEVARGVGSERMDQWLHRLGYGNEDTSGGLTRFWLSDSLQISPEEQLAFLAALFQGRLPFSERTVSILEEIMVRDTRDGKRLRAKTGSGMRDGKTNLGWWVGQVESPAGSHVFVTKIEGEDGVTGMRARKITREILLEMGIY